MNKWMRASDCQLWLIALWTIGFFITLLIFALQASHELYGDHPHPVGGWIMQAFAPLIGTLLLRFTGARITHSHTVDRRVFVIAYCISALYLIGIIVLLSSTSEVKKDELSAEAFPATCAAECTPECTYRIHNDPVAVKSFLVSKRLSRLEDYSLLIDLALIPVGALVVACLGKEAEHGHGNVG